MKFLFNLLAGLVLLSSTAQAQYDPEAKKILDGVSQKYRALESFQANYRQILQGADGEVFDEVSGKIIVKGNKFNLEMGDYRIISDGTTLWTYMKKSNEVNISDYEPGEGEITPTEIYTLYEKGYKYVLQSELKEGAKHLQTIDMEPEDRRSEIAKIRLVVDKNTSMVTRWIIFERGSNSRQLFEINDFEPNAAAPDKLFTFNKADYKGVKVVDLRY